VVLVCLLFRVLWKKETTMNILKSHVSLNVSNSAKAGGGCSGA